MLTRAEGLAVTLQRMAARRYAEAAELRAALDVDTARGDPWAPALALVVCQVQRRAAELAAEAREGLDVHGGAA